MQCVTNGAKINFDFKWIKFIPEWIKFIPEWNKKAEERNKVFVTNSDFLSPISLQPNVLDLRYFKL